MSKTTKHLAKIFVQSTLIWYPLGDANQVPDGTKIIVKFPNGDLIGGVVKTSTTHMCFGSEFAITGVGE